MKKYQKLITISDKYSKLNIISEQNTINYFKMFEFEIILNNGWKNGIMKFLFNLLRMVSKQLIILVIVYLFEIKEI
jgi:hypothetical protein